MGYGVRGHYLDFEILHTTKSCESNSSGSALIREIQSEIGDISEQGVAISNVTAVGGDGKSSNIVEEEEEKTLRPRRKAYSCEPIGYTSRLFVGVKSG